MKKYIHWLLSIIMVKIVMIMPFLKENANRKLTNTGAHQIAHQLVFIGGDEGGHHRKLHIFTLQILFYILLPDFSSGKRVVFR